MKKYTTILAMTFGILLPAAADTFTWTGGGANKKWSTTANWSPAQSMTASDTANFQTGTLASDTVTYDSGAFKNITVQSGAWTANVSSACFTNRPITIASGAKFTLSGASARVNPFSTANNANAVSGLLDLGGAFQTIEDSMPGNNAGFFRNGGEIRNGTLTNATAATAYLANTTFTVGPGANMSGAIRVRFRGGAKLVVDGGTFKTSHVTSQNNNHPIGDTSGTATVVARNGGKFIVTSAPVWLGFSANATMIGDGGTIDLGGQNIILAVNNSKQSILALTNSTFTCGVVQFGYGADSNHASPGKQTLILKNSIANVSRFSGVAMNQSSTILFDGATLVPTAARSDFLPANDKIPTPTIGTGGLIVSNNNDITIAKGMAGAGRLMKAGGSTLTLSGANTFTGGIEVRKGTLALNPGASFPDATTLAMADGTTLKLKYSPDYEFATANLALALDANTSGKVTVDIDLSAGMPEAGRTYTLFAPGLDAAALNRITMIPENSFNVAFAQNGALTITLERTPATHVWTGGGADAKWTTTANWDVDKDFGPLDKVVFGGTGGYSVFDCADGLRLWDITVNSGCHTANVANASFADSPLVVASGASFVLENAEGVVNPFSTLANTNTLAGLLDLGGATQTITTPLESDNKGFFRDGCEIRNGTLTVIPQTASASIRFKNTTVTIGPGANVSGAIRADLNNGHFVIDGGTFTSTYVDREFGNHPIGRDNKSSIVLRNGGRFMASCDVWLAFNANATMVGDGAVIDADDNDFYMSIRNGAESLLALTNSTFTCGKFLFGYPYVTGAGASTVILKDTSVNFFKFGGSFLASGSSILFDGAMLVPKAAATDFIPASANVPAPTIGAGGLIVSNACDVTIAKGMSGAGGLVKKGDGVLTLSGPNTFSGGVDVREGALALNPGASFPDATPFEMADGTTLRLKVSPEGGFASTNIALVLNANTDGKVAIEIDTSSGILESGRVYTLFSSGFNAATLSRIMIDSAYELALAEGGALTLTFSPTTHIWTGAGVDEKWSTGANWNVGDPIASFDHVVFSVGGHSVYDCADGLRLGSVTAGYGCHTVNVAAASFANVPITVASGATFALENASGATNPFSTEANTNVIAGVLDLGGATQDILSATGGNNTGTFRNGGEIRNGTVNLTSAAEQHWDNTDFTFGVGSHVSCTARIYLQNKAHLTFDGGTYTNAFTGNNHVIGASSGVSTLEVSNGGHFVAKRPWFVGHTSSGSLIGDGGIIDVGNNPLYLSNQNAAQSVLALTNAVLTCGDIQFAYGTSGGNTQTLILKDSLVNLSSFLFRHITAASSILFDGATLVPRAAAANFMPSGLPSPTLGADGLVISNAFDVAVAVGMKGAGGLVKMGAGKLTVTGNQSFTGDVVVSNGAFAASSTFAGGLQAASGTAIDVADATFGGDIAIGDGVAFVATNGVNWATTRAVLVAKTTAGVSFPWRQDADGRHLFTKTLGGVTSLYYGKQAGTIVIFK